MHFPVSSHFKTMTSPSFEVCKNFAFPRVKLIFEPWRPPLRCAVLATRKTAMRFQDRLYMLGCFAPVDELEPWHCGQLDRD